MPDSDFLAALWSQVQRGPGSLCISLQSGFQPCRPPKRPAACRLVNWASRKGLMENFVTVHPPAHLSISAPIPAITPLLPPVFALGAERPRHGTMQPPPGRRFRDTWPRGAIFSNGLLYRAFAPASSGRRSRNRPLPLAHRADIRRDEVSIDPPQKRPFAGGLRGPWPFLQRSREAPPSPCGCRLAVSRRATFQRLAPWPAQGRVGPFQAVATTARATRSSISVGTGSSRCSRRISFRHAGPCRPAMSSFLWYFGFPWNRARTTEIAFLPIPRATATRSSVSARFRARSRRRARQPRPPIRPSGKR